jgi:hypothetical protein
MSAQIGKRCQDKNSAYCDRKQESPPVMVQSTSVNEASANVRTHLRVSVRPFSFQAFAIRAGQEAYTQGGGETETQRGVQTGASMAITVARAVVQIR